MTTWLRIVLLAIGGYLAGVVLAAPDAETYPMAVGFGPGPVLTSAMTASAVGATVAALVAAGTRHRTPTIVAVVAGALAVGVVALPGAWRFDMYVATIGAGALLGGLVVTCFGMRRAQLQAVLTGAVVAGLVTAEPIAEFRDFTSMPRRYADYVPVDTQLVNTVWLVLAAITFVAGVSTWVVGRGDDASVDERRGSARELLIGIGLPLVGVGLHWSFENAVASLSAERPEAGKWVLGIGAVVVVIAAALWLRERSGMILLAAMAFAVVGREAVSWSPEVWPLLSVPILLAGVGAWLGRRTPRPLAGIGVLAIVAASSIVGSSPWDTVHIAATLFVVPVAAAYTIVASLPSTTTVTATALALPAVMVLPLVAQFGWTGYAPLTQDLDSWSPSSWTWVSSAVSVTAVLALGAATAWLRYRRPTDTPGPR
ncbi:hypothetical protein ACFWCF_22125 [Rhodococcus sp. NPDC060090]|uniref:hypothetical protein n=1 Tax=Rhodococcus sp. NPDC060090 TaxID=3347056 RepID=UPI0036497F49